MKWGRQYLGSKGFPADLPDFEFDGFFRFDEELLAEVRRRRGDLNRIGFALHVAHIRMTGRTLNSPSLVPAGLLRMVADQIGAPAPDLASIRSLYARGRTLFDHQSAAMEFLGVQRASRQAISHLTSYLRSEAGGTNDNDELVRRAMIWLHEHGYLLPGERRLARLTQAARGFVEGIIADVIAAAVPDQSSEAWVRSLLSEWKTTGRALFEHLNKTPKGRTIAALEKQVEKIAALRSLGADRLALASLPESVLASYADRAAQRPPRKLARIAEPGRTIELACFLRLRLLRLSDQAARMADHRIAALWGRARDEANDREADLLMRYRRLVGDVEEMVDGPQTDAEFRAAVRLRLGDFSHKIVGSRTARIRRALSEHANDLRRIVAAVSRMELAFAPEHVAGKILDLLDDNDDVAADRLIGSLGRVWRDAVDPADPKSLTAVAHAAAAIVLKRSLKNGSVSIPHSIEHRSPDDRLIPMPLWLRDRGRFIRDLGVAEKPGGFLDKINDNVGAALASLDEAVKRLEVRIEKGRLVTPKTPAEESDEAIDATRAELFNRIGGAQLPDILVEVDAATRFSWTLLGRPARSEEELVTLYAAVIALGSDLSAAAVVRMIAGLKAASVGRMMRHLAAGGVLRSASDVVCQNLLGLPIASYWGEGLIASADMMSLEASRHVWSARADPRRRHFAVGTYTHVMDAWGIVYDQPVILNTRQAGYAIEGALRQDLADIGRLAVDTHGFTFFAIALAKLCGLDLCPRLADLPSRKLHLLRGTVAPEALNPVVSPTISMRTIFKGWDSLLRLAASVKEGWCPATFALEKFGSAARGDAVCEAGVALGKLLCTLYLCDYLTNESFRREIGRCLAQGESLHNLQRAIYSRALAPHAGRDTDELAAISSALTLLANIVMAWNARRMQLVVNQSPTRFPPDHLRHIAPIAHAHINMRGVYSFDFSLHGPALLAHGHRARVAAADAP